MKQLLMRWDTTPIIERAMPEGYTLHQHKRGGDEILSESAFAEGWIRTVAQRKSFDRVLFDRFYEDKRIPDDGFFVILNAGGEVVSTATVQLDEHKIGTATLHMVVTDVDHRGKGLGEIVTIAAMNYVLEHGIDIMYLTTDDFRMNAIRIYLKLKFIPVFWDSDMSERWSEIFRKLGIMKTVIYNENEQAENRNFD